MKSRAFGILALVSLAVLTGGCRSSDPARAQLEEIRANPTPELKTLSQRPDDIDNQLTVTFDTNARSFWRDLGVLGLTDHPSHLSPSPVR